MYDPRLGKFLSVDPLTADYPMLTPYRFSSNNPIYFLDLDGLVENPYRYSDPMGYLWEGFGDAIYSWAKWMDRAVTVGYREEVTYQRKIGSDDAAEVKMSVTHVNNVSYSLNLTSILSAGEQNNRISIPYRPESLPPLLTHRKESSTVITDVKVTVEYRGVDGSVSVSKDERNNVTRVEVGASVDKTIGLMEVESGAAVRVGSNGTVRGKLFSSLSSGGASVGITFLSELKMQNGRVDALDVRIEVPFSVEFSQGVQKIKPTIVPYINVNLLPD